MGEYRRTVAALNPQQKEYFKAIQQYDVVFAVGIAGTGKSYIAASEACKQLVEGKVSKIVITRPTVTTEKFGFLPGDLQEKMDPFLLPIFDILEHRLSVSKVKQMLANGVIEIAPLAFMRGRTFNNSFLILDEAQNTTPEQMKMFLTRLGEQTKCIITGDTDQSDLDNHNGLVWALEKLSICPVVKIVEFTSDEHVVRSTLVRNLLKYL